MQTWHPSKAGPQRRAIGSTHVLTIVATMMLFSLLVPSHLASGQPRRSGGHAQVIAHGVQPLPRAEVGWRALTAVARPEDEAPLSERSLGFVLADDGQMLITEPSSGDRSLLDPGEAVLTGQGEKQIRASTYDEDARYYALELVIAEDLEDPATIGSAADLFFAGDSFDPPSGDRDMNLIRDVLDEGETALIEGTRAPALVLVTEGGVAVQPEDGPDETLLAGEAGVFEGDLEITAGDQTNATFVIALIGDRVRSPAPAQNPETASFSVETYACPPGMTFETFDTDACTVSDTPLVRWELTGDTFSNTLSSDDAEIDGATTTWTGLPAGEYFLTLTPDRFLPGHDDYFIPSSNQVTRQADGSTRIYFQSERSNDSINAYVFQESNWTANLVLTIRTCPPGMPLENIQVEPCSPDLTGLQFAIYEDGRELLTDSDATLEEAGVFMWTAVPYGTYELVELTVAEGYDTVYIFGGGGEPSIVDPGDPYLFTIDDTTFSQAGVVDLTLYNIDQVTPFAPGYDADGDLLTDYWEDIYGTDPDDADTDGDGYSDGDEVAAGTDPLDPDDPKPTEDSISIGTDSEGDGLTDETEFQIGTDPNNPDTDDNGLSDGDELNVYGTIPTNADTDGDAWPDGTEILLGSDPFDPSDSPEVPQ